MSDDYFGIGALFKVMKWTVVVAALVAFGLGYSCRGCDWKRPHVEWRRS